MAMLSSLAPVAALVLVLILAHASRPVAAMHAWTNASSTRAGVGAWPSGCVKPGRCTPPITKYSRVLPVTPRQQWNIEGGFCGAMSIQTSHLAFGAWVSQDLVRKANTFGAGHCEPGDGCEIGARNLGQTVTNLKLDFDEWDFNSTKPQSGRYKQWLKKHLAMGHPVVWFVMCKGDDPCPYPNACPNGGAFGHIEPVWGLFSEHPLNDTTVYDTDWVVHSSDQDLNPYYRPMHTLQDTTKMDGNCAKAQPGYGHNEMYPCINDQVDYGVAITGVKGAGLPTSLAVDSKDEPDTRTGGKPITMQATVTVSGLATGKSYVLYRYEGTATLPTTSGDPAGYVSKESFTATAATWVYKDPKGIASDSATYFRAFAQ